MIPSDIRKLAVQVMAFPHPSDCDHLHKATEVLHALADLVEAGESWINSKPTFAESEARLIDVLTIVQAIKP